MARNAVSATGLFHHRCRRYRAAAALLRVRACRSASVRFPVGQCGCSGRVRSCRAAPAARELHAPQAGRTRAEDGRCGHLRGLVDRRGRVCSGPYGARSGTRGLCEGLAGPGGTAQGIRESGLNLAPIVDGVSVRLTIPSLTQERRQEYLKLLNTKTEEARIRVRHIREDILKKVQTAVKEKTAREDDVHRAKEQLQKLVDEYNGKLDDIAKKKESELMSV